MDTTALTGGDVGLAHALRKKSFPNVAGWRRHVSALAAGLAVGSWGGKALFSRTPRYLLAKVEVQQQELARNAYNGFNNILDKFKEPKDVRLLLS